MNDHYSLVDKDISGVDVYRSEPSHLPRLFGDGFIYCRVDYKYKNSKGLPGRRIMTGKHRRYRHRVDYNMDMILERYEMYSYAERHHQLPISDPLQPLMHARDWYKVTTGHLSRNLVGEEIDPMSLREFQQLEQQIDTALKKVRSRKERSLSEQNGVLTKKVKQNEKEVSTGNVNEQQ
ncbi:Agamous-like MADS-box protein AP1 [Linum perenne]